MSKMKESIRNLIGIEEDEPSERFVEILSDGQEEPLIDNEVTVIKDKETGVFYLKSEEGSLTPLLGSNGRVLIDNNNW